MPDKIGSEHFLVQIDRLIDWGPLAPLIQSIRSVTHSGMSPAVAKMLLLARWYGMGEPALLEACQDRMSFRRFLGLPLTDHAADEGLREAFRRQARLAPMESQNLIHAIEAQLLAKGFSIRPGMWAEALVVAVSPQSAADTLAETAVFQPGEIEELIQQKESILVRGGAMMVAKNDSETTDSIALVPVPEPDAAPLQASAEWPWGATTELGERLIVGRDEHSCPYAAELATYPHLSRKHAELTICPLGVWVRDLHSRNGTFVNDERLPKGNAYLIDSDAQIRFGPHCVVQLKLKH